MHTAGGVFLVRQMATTASAPSCWLRPHSPLPTATGRSRRVQETPARRYDTACKPSPSPSPAPAPAQPQPSPSPSLFCAISPALAFPAICSRMQPQRWLTAIYTGVQPSRPQLGSPTHKKPCSLHSQLAFSCGHRVAGRVDVHTQKKKTVLPSQLTCIFMRAQGCRAR